MGAHPVVVAMLTFRRPDDLSDALESLIEHIGDSGVPANILVVDNDSEPSAQPIVARFDPAVVRYIHEPTPGIAAARNRALTEAAGERLLVFIDDDERPQPGWLQQLVSTWERTSASAVVGPVVSSYQIEPDAWVRAGRFFDRLRHPTGTPVALAATNNLLLDLDVVRRQSLTFDDRFGISGGSDSLFTMQLAAGGGTLVWCDEAVVTDVVPASRLTREWVIRRATRLGNSASRTTLALGEGGRRQLARRLRLTAKGVARVVVGGLRRLLGAAIRSDRHNARGARMMARGVGMIGGAWGHAVVEYRRPAGS
jgi:glycosyltransferase involved in cell wall biosynthesis